MTKPATPNTDVSESDAGKGAVESDRPEDTPQRPRGGALDEQGLPKDKTAVCEDAIGANVDGTQG